MRAISCAVIFSAGVLLAGTSLAAHHAFSAEFDATKPVTLKGTVTKLAWSNPHIWIYVDVQSPDGKIVNWSAEGGTPNALFRRGWRKNSLPIGSEIVIDGYLAKDGSATVNAKDVTFPDGRKLFAGSAGTGAPDDKQPKKQ